MAKFGANSNQLGALQKTGLVANYDSRRCALAHYSGVN